MSGNILYNIIVGFIYLLILLIIVGLIFIKLYNVMKLYNNNKIFQDSLIKERN